MLISVFLLFSILSVAFSADVYYCVQLASSRKLEDLKKLIRFANTFPDIRIEKIGEFYTLRAGFFKNKKNAERLREKADKVFKGAFLRRCSLVPERIVVPAHRRKRKKFYTYEVGMKLASLYIKKREFDKAENIYRELVRMYPDSREAKLQLARVLYWEGKYDESLEIYRELEKFKPELVDERRKVEISKIMKEVETLEKEGKLEKAIELLEKLYQEEKENYNINLKLGKLYLKIGKYIKAHTIFSSLLKIYPEDKDIKHLYMLSKSDVVKKNPSCT